MWKAILLDEFPNLYGYVKVGNISRYIKIFGGRKGMDWGDEFNILYKNRHLTHF